MGQTHFPAIPEKKQVPASNTSTHQRCQPPLHSFRNLLHTLLQKPLAQLDHIFKLLIVLLFVFLQLQAQFCAGIWNV